MTEVWPTQNDPDGEPVRLRTFLPCMADLVIVAGATGDLGGRIARALIERGAAVRALVRPGTDRGRLEPLRRRGVEVVPVDFADAPAVREACSGAVCVVSALSGLEPVIVDAQTQLLEAAIAAGVPRFIPSDFSIDYRDIPDDENRNFALRRRFRARIDTAPIRATSVFNGGFADMLDGQMPLIVKPIRRVLYWGSPDVTFPLTTKDDTAAFTAAVALDPEAPRDLHIAGSETSSRDLAAAMSEISGHRYGVLRAGSLGGLKRLTGVVRRLFPGKDQVFPPWQGMQYLHNMFTGRAPSAPTDNGRYPGLSWTTARDLLRRAS
jgi:uncharacterized protein YbjT (DUF2867 family)